MANIIIIFFLIISLFLPSCSKIGQESEQNESNMEMVLYIYGGIDLVPGAETYKIVVYDSKNVEFVQGKLSDADLKKIDNMDYFSSHSYTLKDEEYNELIERTNLLVLNASTVEKGSWRDTWLITIVYKDEIYDYLISSVKDYEVFINDEILPMKIKKTGFA